MATEPPSTEPNVTLTIGDSTVHGTFRLTAVESTVAQLQEEINQPNPDTATLKQAGSQLFEALLGNGALFRAYTRATAQNLLKEQALAIHINSDQPTLMAIPWEYLYDQEQEQWLALHPEISLVRGLPLIRHTPQPVDGLLRVLVMASEPTDLVPVNSRQEVVQLEAIEATGIIEVIQVEPTYAALQSALRQHRPHIFHFIGHGMFSDTENQGKLAFCRSDDPSRFEYIEAERLATLLAGCETLGLALLNACDGAVTGVDSAFAGLTQRLIQQRIPAVIAMQAPIVDDHAIRFSQEFYAALGDSRSVLEAVDEGRKRINEIAYTWGIPAFYLQSSQPFTIQPLSASQRADWVWQKSQQVERPEQRQQLLEGAIKLVPNHAGALAGLAQIEKREEAAQLYNAALSQLGKERWLEAQRTLAQVEERLPNYRETRVLLAQCLGHLRGPEQPPADPELYRPILNALAEGRLTFFLGDEVGNVGQPPQDGWVAGLYSPGTLDAASALAQHLPKELQDERSLLRICQYTILHEGHFALYNRLHQLYANAHAPTMLHRLLAELPAQLGDGDGYPREERGRYVLLSTGLDNLLEQAFQDAGQPYHLMAYRPSFVDEHGVTQVDRLLHYPPGIDDESQATPILKPNKYVAHEQDHHPIIVKLCGRQVTPEPDSVAVTEDHYLDYKKSMAILPTTLLNQIQYNNFLFFGHSLHAWHLRLIWQRLSLPLSDHQLPKWAIIPDPPEIERKFWQSQQIEVINATPEDVVAHISSWLNRKMNTTSD